MSDYVVSLVRTLAPVVAGAAATWLIKVGIEIDSAALESLIFAVVTGVWYAIVRWAEDRFPWAGWLLGIRKQPVY